MDLSVLNQHLDNSSFQLETLESIRKELNMGEWTSSINLSDAYLHIPVNQPHRNTRQQSVPVYSHLFQVGNSATPL